MKEASYIASKSKPTLYPQPLKKCVYILFIFFYCIVLFNFIHVFYYIPTMRGRPRPAGETMSLSWPGNASRSHWMTWRNYPGREKSGPPHHHPTVDEVGEDGEEIV